MSKRDNEGVKVDAVTSGVVVTVAAAVAEWLNELMAVTAVVEAVAAAAVASKALLVQGAGNICQHRMRRVATRSSL